ncbi:MAG: hypothetical protein R3D67_11805 [Hyphomicrobiaceae bacterium]
MSHSIEQRRVRFDSIEGLSREHLGTAGEIWLSDLCLAPWASREMMRLGAHLVGYMASPDPRLVKLQHIDAVIQVTREEIKTALRLMKLFGAAAAFSIDQDELRVALHLTSLQRLKILETVGRLDQLLRTVSPDTASNGQRWVPPPSICEEARDEASDNALRARLKRDSLQVRPAPLANAPERQASVFRPRP